jgi:hypothetical protein
LNESQESALDRLRRLLRAILDSIIRAAVLVLVSWPLLLVAILVQERLETAPPAGLVAFFLTLVFAKAALLMLLGRRISIGIRNPVRRS